MKLTDLIPPGENLAINSLSLRDWFAGQALMAAMSLQLELTKSGSKFNAGPTGIASDAYELADAMLKERAK